MSAEGVRPLMTSHVAELLARVEAAEGPDREIDARLHVACFPDETGMVYPGSPSGLKGSWHDTIGKMDWTAWDHLSHARGSDLGMVANHHYWPTYTASLDASLALCERVLPGGWPGFQRNRRVEPSRAWSAWLEVFPDNKTDPETHEGENATPALALIEAMLRALIDREPADVC